MGSSLTVWTVIVTLEEKAGVKHLAIPNVMLTVLGASFHHLSWFSPLKTQVGVVLGFVLSYRYISSAKLWPLIDKLSIELLRAMSGYDRYWQGRTAWSDVIQHSRSLGRLIWYHVPPRLTPRTAEEISTGLMNRTSSELVRVMAEKRMALDLILGFAVALKHHLRGKSIDPESLMNWS